MNIRLKFAYEDAPARQLIDSLTARLTSMEEVNAVIETAARSAVEQNISTHYATKPNRLGAPKTGYWEKARASVVGESDAGGVTIRIPHAGVRLHYYGGTVRPSGRTSEVTGKPIRSLSIPVVAAAHGKSPREFGGRLYWRPFKDPDKSGLFLRQGGKPAATDPLYYVLKKSATIKADANVLPSEATIRAAIGASVGNLLAALTEN